MIEISEPISVTSPHREISWERREFPSPDQKWIAVYKDPYEWRMGAVAWECSLIPGRNLSDVDQTDSGVLFHENMLHCPVDQIPWRDDSLMLSSLQWNDGLILFDLFSQKRTNIAFKDSPMNVQWSPFRSTLLVRLLKSLALLDGEGEIITTVPIKSEQTEHPFTCWLKSGDIFLVVGRSSRRAKPRASFYQSSNGKKVKEIVLDPNGIAPYDVDKYKVIPRGRYSLIVSSSTMSVGNLLDRWNQVFYDGENELLYLSVYRPTSEIIDVGGTSACKVAESWVEIPMNQSRT